MRSRTGLRHRGWYIGTATSIGVVAAVVLLEIGLRLVAIPAVDLHRRGPATFDEHRRFFMHDPELGWRGRPNTTGPFGGWEFSTEVSLNDLGFRDAVDWRRKRPTQYEVLLLGDSITWGYGVQENRRYSDLLENELRNVGIDVVINNVSVPGYDTGLEWLLYRQLKRRGCPDLVMIGLYGNDISENGSPSQGPYAKPYFRLREGQLELANVPVPTSHGWNDRQGEFARSWMVWLRAHVRVYALAGWMKETMRQVFEKKPAGSSGHDVRGIEITTALLREWAADIERDHRQVAVIVLPDEAGLVQKETLATEIAAAQSGVRLVLRLTEAFRKATDGLQQPLFFRLDGAHWTEQAHDVAARHIARMLVEASVFQRAPSQCADET